MPNIERYLCTGVYLVKYKRVKFSPDFKFTAFKNKSKKEIICPNFAKGDCILARRHSNPLKLQDPILPFCELTNNKPSTDIARLTPEVNPFR